jgi:hypothetical protein
MIRVAAFGLATLMQNGNLSYARNVDGINQVSAETFQRPVVPLKLSAFSRGISNCSRPTPRSAGFWEVSEKEVASIDKVLIRHLRTSKLKGRVPFPLEDYARQYLGLQSDGRRFVYINALYVAKTSWSVYKASNEFFRLCDGGGEAWGIEYDLQRKTFGEIETNSE